MRRRLFHVCAALSSVLMLASLSLALRSYWVADQLERLHYSFTADTSILRRREFSSAEGSIYIDLVWAETDASVSLQDRPLWLNKNHFQYSHHYNSASATDNFEYQGGRPRLGFGYHSTTRIEPPARGSPRPDTQMTRRHLLIPWYFPIVLFSILPVFSLRMILRARCQRRLASNLCPSCGYDLRFSPTRCPECGTPSPYAQESPLLASPPPPL